MPHPVETEPSTFSAQTVQVTLARRELDGPRFSGSPEFPGERERWLVRSLPVAFLDRSCEHRFRRGQPGSRRSREAQRGHGEHSGPPDECRRRPGVCIRFAETPSERPKRLDDGPQRRSSFASLSSVRVGTAGTPTTATFPPQSATAQSGSERSRPASPPRCTSRHRAPRGPSARRDWLNGAAPESNRPSRGLHDRTGFEDPLGRPYPGRIRSGDGPPLVSRCARVQLATSQRGDERGSRGGVRHRRRS